MEAEFKPGDIVRLKSSGCDMTVASVGVAVIECLWMMDDGELKEYPFPPAVLEHVEFEEEK